MPSYYVRFVDANGTPITSAGGQQWFQVSDLGLGFANPVAISSATAGAGSGRVAFDPLTLTLGSQAATQLETALFNSSPLSQIEVASYTDGTKPTLLDDYSFGTDLVAGTTTDATGAEHLTVRYGQVQQIHDSTASNGLVQPQSTTNWNLATNTDDYSATIAAPTTAPPSAASSTPAPADYYVRFVNANGTSITGNAQWFKVSDLGLGFANSTTLGSIAAGTGGGKVTFDPLTLTLGSSQAVTQLETALFNGTRLSQIEVAAYAAGGGALLDDYSFGTDYVTGATTDATGAVHLSITYGEVQQGAANWDLVTNTADYAPTTIAPTAGPPVVASSTTAASYYVRFVDANGAPITGDGGAQWFKVSDLGLSFANSTTIGSSTAGAGGGRTTFAPLTLTLGSDNAVIQLESALFSGTHLSQVEVASYTGGQQQVLLDDYSFGTDFVTGATTDATGAQHLSITYGQVQQIHDSIASDGSVQPQSPTNWDLVKNIADYAPTTAAQTTAPPTVAKSTPAPADYYVRFVDANGTSITSAGGQQWFQVSDLSLGFANAATFSGSTVGAGKAGRRSPADADLGVGQCRDPARDRAVQRHPPEPDRGRDVHGRGKADPGG